MDLIGPTVTKLFSRLIAWAEAQIKDRIKRKKIDKLIDETARRASMTSSCVDLGAKFKDPHLVEELLANRVRFDVGKDEAIRRFLGEGYDDSAYEFVSEFWNSVDEIMSTGEESLAARKAVEGIETANRKLDDLLERTPEASKEDAEGKLLAQGDFISMLERHNEVAAERSGTYQLGEIVKELVPNISSDAGEALSEYRDKQFPLLQCLEESWKEDVRPNLMLVGEGGIGKTVSMLETASKLCHIGIPAVYIPLHALPFLNVQDNFIRSYIKGTVLQRSRSALAAIEADLSCKASGEPSLVILLDGWNEIRERQVGNKWLTDFIKEEIEHNWLSSTNAQVVIAGRVHMDPSGTWNHCWRYLKVQRLKRTNIEAYLKDAGVSPPVEGLPVWEILGNPLMLTLYVCNETQKSNCKGNLCCRFINDNRASTQAAVIWNFLQCQINKAGIISEDDNVAFPKIIAINYAAAYVGRDMAKDGVFRISRSHLRRLLDEAKEHFERVWEESSYVEWVNEHCGIIGGTWNTTELFNALFFSTKLLIDETPLSASEDQQNGDSAEYGIGFLHQNFRDFYAALFMRNEFAPFGTLLSPEDSSAWVESPQSREILDMLAFLFDDEELNKLWNSTEGKLAEDGSNAMFHVVEVMQRRRSLSDLSFENRDLRFMNLQGRGFSGTDVNFRGSRISYRTFLPKVNIFGQVSEAMWLPSEGGGDGRYILTLDDDVMAFWDTRTGLNTACFKSYSAVATNSNGRLLAFAGNDGFDIYDTSVQMLPSYHVHQNKDYSAVDTVALFPDSRLIVYGGGGGQAYLCDTAVDETLPLEIPDDFRTKLEYEDVRQIVCSEDGKKVAILYGLGVVALWAVNRKGLEICVNFEAAYDFKAACDFYGVVDLQINKDGSGLLVVTTKAEVYISEQGDALSWKKLDHKIEKYDAFKVSFKHELLAVAFGNCLNIRSLRSDGYCASITMATDLNPKASKVSVMNFSPSGEKIVCVHEDGSVTVWNVHQGYSGLSERPLLTIEGRYETFRDIRLQANNTLLTLTKQGRFLKWDASKLCCIDNFKLKGIVPDHWDLSFDGNRCYTSTNMPNGSLICVYDAQGTLIKARQHENKVLDIRLDEQSGVVMIVEDATNWQPIIEEDEQAVVEIGVGNTSNLVCLDAETLDVASRVKLGDCGSFTVAPLDGKSVVGLDEQCCLTIRSLSDLGAISVIDIWEAMARSKKQEIHHIGMKGKGEELHVLLPEFTQLETFRTHGESGAEMALVVVGIVNISFVREVSHFLRDVFDHEYLRTTTTSFTGSPYFLLVAVIDLAKGVATMASLEESDDMVTGIAVNPGIDRFFQSTSSGRIELRELSTGEYIKSVEPIPNIALVNADFRGVEFETDKLRDMVRASGAIVDDDDLIVNVELPQKS